MQLASWRTNRVLSLQMSGNLFSYQISNYSSLVSNLLLKIENQANTSQLLILLTTLRRQDIQYMGVHQELEILSKDLQNVNAWNSLYKKLLSALRSVYKTNTSLIFTEAYFLSSVEKNKYAALGRIQELMISQLDAREQI